MSTPETTVASNPGNLELQWRHYLRYAREQLIIVVAAAAIGLPGALIAWLCGSLPLAIGLAFLPVASLWAVKDHVQQMRRHFRIGCVNPAIVVSSDPVLIATLTDLRKSDGPSHLAIKINRGRMENLGLPRPRIGDRLATVATYTGDLNDGKPAWGQLRISRQGTSRRFERE